MRKPITFCDICDSIIEYNQVYFKIHIRESTNDACQSLNETLFDHDEICARCFNNWKETAFKNESITTPKEDFLP